MNVYFSVTQHIITTDSIAVPRHKLIQSYINGINSMKSRDTGNIWFSQCFNNEIHASHFGNVYIDCSPTGCLFLYDTNLERIYFYDLKKEDKLMIKDILIKIARMDSQYKKEDDFLFNLEFLDVFNIVDTKLAVEDIDNFIVNIL